MFVLHALACPYACVVAKYMHSDEEFSQGAIRAAIILVYYRQIFAQGCLYMTVDNIAWLYGVEKSRALSRIALDASLV